jgi:hypothetical protein
VNALYREVDAFVKQRNPYSARISNVDQNGRCAMFVKPNIEFPYDLVQLGLGVIAGNVVTELRNALDYIVAALISAGGATPYHKHQFPIYDERNDYHARVWTPGGVANPNGPLRGVTMGLQEIYGVQPFNQEPPPNSDSLHLVRLFANADKHRAIAAYVPALGEIKGTFTDGVRVLSSSNLPEPTAWSVNTEYELIRFVLARPLPPKFNFKANVSVVVLFGTRPVGNQPHGIAVPLPFFEAAHAYVTEIVERFKAPL